MKQQSNKKNLTDEDILKDNQSRPQTDTPTTPSIEGEESISGSTPDVESDDDVLEDAHEVGEQADEDLEHPEDVDISRDIDDAEEHIRTH